MSTFDRPNYADSQRIALLNHIPACINRLLDIGCNQGGFGSALKNQRNIEVWGVEPQTVAAEIASRKLDKVINDYFGGSNPIPDCYFDLITFNDSLEHMIDPAAALKLARTKLTPSGRVHCCVPNMRHIENLEHLLFDKDWCYEEFGIRDATHLRFFTQKSITRLFESTGYRVIAVIGINESWWEPEKRARRLLFRLFPGFTADMRHIQILVIAEPK